MGLFDLPAPLLSWLNDLIPNSLGDALHLIIWAALASAVSMLLYRWVSPQNRLAEVKIQIAEHRQRLLSYDGDVADVLPDIGSMLSLSLKHLVLTLKPALIASLPALFIIAWVSNSFGFQMPAPGVQFEVVAHTASDAGARTLSWQQSWPESGSLLILANIDAGIAVEVEQQMAVPVIHKKVWWNTLFGNPIGYLPSHAGLDQIELKLQPRQILKGAPAWLASWEVTFFTALIAFSLGLKFLLRIE